MPMTKKSYQKSIVNKVASKRVLDQNTAAFKTYDTYKKTADIDRARGVCVWEKSNFQIRHRLHA